MLKECITYPKVNNRNYASPLVKICENIWMSAVTPLNCETGKLAGEDIRTQTKQCIEKVITLLKKCDLDLNHVMKVKVYLTDIDELEAFDEVYGSYFSEPYPARTVLQVCGLPHHAKVQLECEVMDYRCLEVLCAQQEDEDECCSGCCSSK